MYCLYFEINMADRSLFGVVVVAFISAVHCSEFCTKTSTSNNWPYRGTNTFWCDHGCCGGFYDRYCCTASTVGMVVGIVIGVLVLIGAIVTIVVCVVCCRRQQARQGQVVTTGTGATTVCMAGTAQPYVMAPQAGYTAAYPQMPAAYPQVPAAYPQQGGYGDQGYAQPPPSYDTIQQQK